MTDRPKTALEQYGASAEPVAPPWWQDSEKLLRAAMARATSDRAIRRLLRAKLGELATHDTAFRDEMIGDLRAIERARGGRESPEAEDKLLVHIVDSHRDAGRDGSLPDLSSVEKVCAFLEPRIKDWPGYEGLSIDATTMRDRYFRAKRRFKASDPGP